MINSKRARWHLQLGVCRTKGGLKRHLEIVGLDDIRLLMSYLHCSLEDLIDRAWERINGVKN